MKLFRADWRERIEIPEVRDNPWVVSQLDGPEPVWVDLDPPNIQGHFGTFFGGLDNKQYENRYIGCLREIHERRHQKTIPYGHTDAYSWSKSMMHSEVESSLFSDCFIYLHVPGLREKTFQHPIWIDRFLPLLGTMPIEQLEAHIRSERRRAMNAPEYDDTIEHQIRNYGMQNEGWCRIWGEKVGYGRYADIPAWRIVENHMAAIARMGAKEAFASHAAWLEDVSAPHGNAMVPFLHQALAFEPVYHETNRRHGNWFLNT